MRRESQRNFHTCQAVWGEFDFFCRKLFTKPPKFVQQLSKTKSCKVLNDWGKELQNSAEKEHLQTTIPPNFQDLKTTRTRHSACASQILQTPSLLRRGLLSVKVAVGLGRGKKRPPLFKNFPQGASAEERAKPLHLKLISSPYCALSRG